MNRTMRTALVIALAALIPVTLSTARDKGAPAADMTVAAAIQGAAADPEHGVFGRFRITVAATGRKDGQIYLNSERDYRDQRNLTVVVLPMVQKKLATLYGSDADRALKGKTILVTGIAKRVTVWFFAAHRRRTDKYYYQTHVEIVDPRQIEIVE